MNEKVSLKRTAIKEKTTGKELVSILVPEGWTSVCTENKNRYNGYGQSISVQADIRMPDNSTAVFYSSALHYRNDHLKTYKDFTSDMYGNLHRKAVTIDEFLERRAKESLKEVTNLKFVKQIVKDGHAQKEAEIRKKKEEKLENNYSLIDTVYYRQAIREYSFERNGYKRKRALSATIEAVEYVNWAPLPERIVQGMNDPFMRDVAKMMMASFKNARFDQNLNQWIYTISYYVDWNVTGLFIMDAPEKTYDELFKNVFIPIVTGGASYTDTFRNDLKVQQAKIDASNKTKRDEQEKKNETLKEEQKRQRAIEEQNRQRRKETWDYVHKTNQEIAAMRKDTWEKQQKSQAKIREMWGDTLRGDTRFVDKYGDEHVIHTYDKYAYKSGSTYVTSDSPLDHGWDWEELEKKKY